MDTFSSTLLGRLIKEGEGGREEGLFSKFLRIEMIFWVISLGDSPEVDRGSLGVSPGGELDQVRVGQIRLHNQP